EGGQGLRDLRRQLRPLQRGERLLARQVRLVEEALDPATTTLVDLELGEVVQVPPEGPAFALGLLRDLLGVAREGRQFQRGHHDPGRLDGRGRRRERGRRGHVPTSAISASYAVRSTGNGVSSGTSIVAAEAATRAFTALAVTGLPSVSKSAR